MLVILERVTTDDTSQLDEEAQSNPWVYQPHNRHDGGLQTTDFCHDVHNSDVIQYKYSFSKLKIELNYQIRVVELLLWLKINSVVGVHIHGFLPNHLDNSLVCCSHRENSEEFGCIVLTFHNIFFRLKVQNHVFACLPTNTELFGFENGNGVRTVPKTVWCQRVPFICSCEIPAIVKC